MRRILSVALVLVCVVVTGWFLLATSRYGRTIGLLIRAAEVD